MLEQTRSNNINRFKGFGDIYDQNRPSPPQEVISILEGYLGTRPEVVVDVGCGTGLSTLLWFQEAGQTFGVEPSDDMRAVAEQKWRSLGEPEGLRFIKALSHQLPFEDQSADIVTCSQSFHWMEPESTLREFARVLRPGGIFAAYDYDWPPTFHWEIEAAYMKLNALADSLAGSLPPAEQQARKWSKNQHLTHIRNSGLFRYTREIVFHSRETCDAERYANLALTQGGLQTALKYGATQLSEEADRFRDKVNQAFAGKQYDVLFGYRMRFGIK